MLRECSACGELTVVLDDDQRCDGCGAPMVFDYLEEENEDD